MSKDTPEVGDVLNIIFPEYTVLAVVIEDTERETRILRKYKYDFEKRYTYDVASVNKKTEPDYYKAVFHKRATYLGKSKTNVEQLFEVQDNGRCIEDNKLHAESTVLFKDLENEK